MSRLRDHVAAGRHRRTDQYLLPAVPAVGSGGGKVGWVGRGRGRQVAGPGPASCQPRAAGGGDVMGRWAVLGTLAVAAWPCSGAMGARAASPQATMPAGDLDLLVRVESPYLAAAVRPAVGGRMVSLIYKSTGRQLLYDDPKWLRLHRELGLGEHFLAFGGGIFDVVNPADGSTSYPGFVQCAAYEAKAVRTPRGRGIQVRCRRGRLEIVRRMVLAAGGPCLEICAAYRNVGDRPIRTAPHLRIELACSKAGDVFITREPGGVFRYGLGGAFEPGRGFVFCRSRSPPEAVVILYSPAEDACQ